MWWEEVLLSAVPCRSSKTRAPVASVWVLGLQVGARAGSPSLWCQAGGTDRALRGQGWLLPEGHRGGLWELPSPSGSPVPVVACVLVSF